MTRGFLFPLGLKIPRLLRHGKPNMKNTYTGIN